MKNKRIAEAYDAINPTQEQKEKMLLEILSRADFSDQPEQKPGKAEAALYTAEPTRIRKRSVFATIAASIALLAVSGAVLLQMMKAPSVPAQAEPTQAAERELPDGPTKYPVYNAIIADFSEYLNGIVTDSFFVHEGLKELLINCGAEYTLGWALRDLDGDGTEELLFTDGWLIYTALSLFDEEEGGGAPILFTSSVQDRYYLCQDDVVMKIYDYCSDGTRSQYEFFEVDMDTPGFQKLLEVVIPGPEGWRIGKTVETAKPVDEETGRWTAEEKYPLQAIDVTLLRSKEDITANGTKLKGFESHQKILEQYYLAVEQRWDAKKLEMAGMGQAIADDNAYDRLGWCILDHDNDGKSELVISDGEIVYSVYQTWTDGTLVHAASSADNDRLRLCQIRLYHTTTTAENCTIDRFFKMQQGERDMVEMVVCENGSYYAGKSMADMIPISADEAESIFFSHPTVGVPIQLFNPDAAGIVQLSGIREYDTVLRLYSQSVEERWDWDQYEQYGLSTMIAHHETWLDLGWCLLDIDSNGIEELLITNGERIYDLYTIHFGDVKQVAVSRSGSQYALCQNAVLSSTAQGDGLPWGKSYFSYQDGSLTWMDTVSLEAEQYYQGTADTIRRPISMDEAGKIMGEYIELELFITPFQPAPEDGYNADMTYAHVLQKYRKALSEKWNFGRCVSRGISGSVSYYVKDPGQLGYTFLNLDGGEEELIVISGEDILDLYTVRDGTVVRVLSYEIGQQYTLTEDKQILRTQYDNGRAASYTLYKLVNPALSEESGLVVQEAYLRETTGREPGPWHLSTDGETFGAPCGDFDVEARLTEMAPVELTFRRFN